MKTSRWQPDRTTTTAISFSLLGTLLGISLLEPRASAAEEFPYREIKVAYTNQHDGTRLAGTLSLPKASKPVPALLLITGMGPQDRDETIGELKPFAVLADAMARKGMAVLRVDDRGVGESTGNWMSVGYDAYSQDVVCGLQFLKNRPEVNPRQLGLLGHSEGGRIAAKVAVNSKDVAFIVLLAAPCVSGEEFIIRHNEDMLRRAGVSGADLHNQLDGVRKLVRVLQENPDQKLREQKVREVVAEKKQSAEETDREVAINSSPWARDYMTDDTTKDLRLLECPVLALWGAKDVLVVPEQNANGLRQALPQAAPPRLVLKTLPLMNHLFQKCNTGDPSEFFQIKGCMEPAALDAIASWTQQVTKL